MTNDTASTTAPPITIVEFLTARLDEDAARLDRVSLSRLSSGRRNGKATIRRQYARIVAHRAIIAAHLDVQSQGALGGVIQVLAAIYADHEDYRQEWKS